MYCDSITRTFKWQEANIINLHWCAKTFRHRIWHLLKHFPSFRELLLVRFWLAYNSFSIVSLVTTVNCFEMECRITDILRYFTFVAILSLIIMLASVKQHGYYILHDNDNECFTRCGNIPYPEPVYTGWSSVHWNATGMPLVDPVYTGIPLGHPANTCRVHWNTTGKTWLKQPHTGMPLEKL